MQNKKNSNRSMLEKAIEDVDASSLRLICKASLLFETYIHLKNNFKIELKNDLVIACIKGNELDSAILLFGYAFENLFKAKIAHDFCGAIDDNGFLKNEIKGHRLIDFIKTAKLAYPPESLCQSLKYLEKYTVWHGRYTIPLESRDWEIIDHKIIKCKRPAIHT